MLLELVMVMGVYYCCDNDDGTLLTLCFNHFRDVWREG